MTYVIEMICVIEMTHVIEMVLDTLFKSCFSKFADGHQSGTNLA